MQTSPLGPLGNLFQLAAVVASGVLGIMSKPALFSFLVGGILFTLGYILVRLPHMLALYQRDGMKICLAFLYLLIGNSVLAAAIYAIGWVFS